MNEYEKLAESFSIFAKYPDQVTSISAEHDVIYSGPDSRVVDDQDVARLYDLGWHVDEDYNCFRYWT